MIKSLEILAVAGVKMEIILAKIIGRIIFAGKDNSSWQRIGRMWGNDQTSLVGDERNTRSFHSQKTVTQNEGRELYGRNPCFQDTVDREG